MINFLANVINEKELNEGNFPTNSDLYHHNESKKIKMIKLCDNMPYVKKFVKIT